MVWIEEVYLLKKIRIVTDSTVDMSTEELET